MNKLIFRALQTRMLVAAGAMVVPALVLAQDLGDRQIKDLITKLGSPSFHDRETASRMLRDHFEAESALREASRSSDREIARRAAEVLASYETRRIRELPKLIREGRVEAAIETLGRCSSGRHDAEAWRAVGGLVRSLGELNDKNAKKLGKVLNLWTHGPPLVLSARRITETTPTKEGVGRFFLLAGDVDVDISRLKRGQSSNALSLGGVVAIASGRVRIAFEPLGPNVIIASGDVQLFGDSVGLIVLSCGNVTLDCDLADALVIAKGKIICTKPMENARLIGGKTVAYDKRHVKDCVVTENEAYPLGFIRWAQPAKKKPAPKPGQSLCILH